MVIQVMACEFVAGLHRAIGMDSLIEMVHRNIRELDSNVCHSHDFCDANMVMMAAFEAVMGRPPQLDCNTEQQQAAAEEDLLLADKAWALARSLLAQEFI